MKENKQKHFIKNIEIKNFKCFNDFKAEGFGRVNLIGGKNNVGKTAFMEACYIENSKDVFDLYNKLLEVETHRNIINNLLYSREKKADIEKLIKDNLSFHIEKTKIQLNKNTYSVEIIISNKKEIYEFSKLTELLDLSFINAKSFHSLDFLGQDTSPDWLLNHMIGTAKLEDQYHKINSSLLKVFNVDNIDMIDNLPYLKKAGKYQPLAQFGQGIKSFIDIIFSLSLANNKTIFIDEIENGIHYTNLDKLWEFILAISKKQNVQVFATTHSKECIESYARVAKRLENEEIRFLSLYRNKENELKSITFDYEKIQDRIKLGLDNR
ncbi:MAG: AAA family ATPase [Sulfurovum sp.]|nr:AAA family ATPase [Sulfurovum sp.]MCB4758091.1 AAA family ATPase [Sulfurovum sp.]MCB4781849.1 AAA family ATPase [Sulfurovum sp.]